MLTPTYLFDILSLFILQACTARHEIRESTCTVPSLSFVCRLPCKRHVRSRIKLRSRTIKYINTRANTSITRAYLYCHKNSESLMLYLVVATRVASSAICRSIKHAQHTLVTVSNDAIWHEEHPDRPVVQTVQNQEHAFTHLLLPKPSLISPFGLSLSKGSK